MLVDHDHEEQLDKEGDVDPGDIAAEEVDPMDYLRKLIKLCIYIFKLKEKDDGTNHRNRRPPILQMLINYETAIVKQKLVYDDVIEDIFKAYVANKKLILADDYAWLLNAKNDVKFNYCKPGTKPKSYMSTCCICVGSIFRMAGDLYDKHLHDKVDPNSKTGNAYTYLPTRMVRYLYLLFLESIENSDHKDKIGRLVDKKEKTLGIVDGKYEEDFGEGMFGSGFKGGLEAIVKVVFGSLQKHGIKLPEGMTLDNINFGDITGIASKLFNADDPFIAELLNEVKGCKGGAELTKLLFAKANDPEFLGKITKLFNINVSTEKIQEAVQKNEQALTTLISNNFPSIQKKMDEVTSSAENKGISMTEAAMIAISSNVENMVQNKEASDEFMATAAKEFTGFMKDISSLEVESGSSSVVDTKELSPKGKEPAEDETSMSLIDVIPDVVDGGAILPPTPVVESPQNIEELLSL